MNRVKATLGLVGAMALIGSAVAGSANAYGGNGNQGKPGNNGATMVDGYDVRTKTPRTVDIEQLKDFDKNQCTAKELKITFKNDGIVKNIGKGTFRATNVSNRTCILTNQTSIYTYRDGHGNPIGIYDETRTNHTRGKLHRITFLDYSRNFVVLKPRHSSLMELGWEVGGCPSNPNRLMLKFEHGHVEYKGIDMDGAIALCGDTTADPWRSHWTQPLKVVSKTKNSYGKTTRTVAYGYDKSVVTPRQLDIEGVVEFDKTHCQAEELKITFKYRGIRKNIGLGVFTAKNTSNRTCVLNTKTHVSTYRKGESQPDMIYDETRTNHTRGKLHRITELDYSRNWVVLKPGQVSKMQYGWEVGNCPSKPNRLEVEFDKAHVKVDNIYMDGAKTLCGDTSADPWRSYWTQPVSVKVAQS